MNSYSNKKILYWGIGILAVIFIVGIIITNILKAQNPEQNYATPLPEQVVRQYFTAWNSKDYVNMYATISDGFKKIEPTAKDLTSFKNYASSQDITQVQILSLKEQSNDGTTAQVDYSVSFTVNSGGKKTFDGTFTLKYRQGDIISGWKLIHPYGNNIDTS